MLSKYCSILLVVLLFSFKCFADESLIDIKGGGSGLLMFRDFNQKYGGWSDVRFSSSGSGFRLYSVPVKMLPVESGVVASSDADRVSPDKKYLMVQRTDAGEVVDEQGNSTISAQAYCDMVSLDTGCVKNVGSALQCDGTWAGGGWKVSTGEVFDFLKEGISPSQLVSKVSSLSPDESRSNSLRDWLFMGAESYMACFPSRENISQLNDIGYYLDQGGEHVFAMQFYNKLLSVAPGRIPLKLNIADSLWAMGKLSEAKSYYVEYQKMMTQKGDEKKIPKRVELRVKG